ncbi:hypothetical protein GCM10023193_27170 [Planotetraspora kaengkrachanensis]|uniref:Uncharacterized protein n=1 Tax=Planotetraspora kaengkrachanensis TaxID=575193 RepID=A0A8J3LUW6_9ACTN|nr:hypothetical protein Pka01_13810 [Planotetraspora kaengkrachanensis]
MTAPGDGEVMPLGAALAEAAPASTTDIVASGTTPAATARLRSAITAHPSVKNGQDPDPEESSE